METINIAHPTPAPLGVGNEGGKGKGVIMARYRKKPLEVEAFQWTGGPDQAEDPSWIVDAIKSGKVWFEGTGTSNCRMIVTTLNGPVRACAGEYIVKGIKGELYPCNPDIFKATYQPVS